MHVCFTISNFKYYHKNKYSKYSIMELIEVLSFVQKVEMILYIENFSKGFLENYL